MDTELIDLEVPAAPVDIFVGDEPAPRATLQAPARLLEYDWKKFVALPVHTTLEIVEQPQVIEVPGAPYYSAGMMRWQGHWLPVLDLCALLSAYRKAGTPALRHALVVAYQTAPGQPIEHGAIAAASLPQTLQVSDEQQCELPSDSDLWGLIATSCFGHAGTAVPIVHTGKLFGTLWD